jgi:fructose-bisphosphate aldolase, class I
LDSLASRLSEYYKAGARFTKWRAPLEIDVSAGRPTTFAIESNMRDLARFALISQAEGLGEEAFLSEHVSRNIK